MPVLRGNNGANPGHRSHGGGALERFLQQARAPLQRTKLFGHHDAVHIAGKTVQTSAFTAGEHQGSGVQSMLQGDALGVVQILSELRRRGDTDQMPFAL